MVCSSWDEKRREVKDVREILKREPWSSWHKMIMSRRFQNGEEGVEKRERKEKEERERKEKEKEERELQQYLRTAKGHWLPTQQQSFSAVALRKNSSQFGPSLRLSSREKLKRICSSLLRNH